MCDTFCVDKGTGLSKATVSSVCAKVSDILAAKLPEFVKFPDGADAALAKQEHGAIAGTGVHMRFMLLKLV
ncbi:hypothetical protein DPMN_160607 [Dreissena polymorpha]|uniref:Uncharacterized protein n=1 Tax=Dreissena polymorpha TaxID=45954 RepID=A0A9D4ISQ0_DREPO|nr:hypothetical protein DPMN_160607 [Dreissena polymorpha]